MTINVWGIALLIIVILSCVGAFICSGIRKATPIGCIISAQEDARFLAESIAIQPDNSPVFEDISICKVIAIGMQKMNDENFSMLQGVNLDV